MVGCFQFVHHPSIMDPRKDLSFDNPPHCQSCKSFALSHSFLWKILNFFGNCIYIYIYIFRDTCGTSTSTSTNMSSTVSCTTFCFTFIKCISTHLIGLLRIWSKKSHHVSINVLFWCFMYLGNL